MRERNSELMGFWVSPDVKTGIQEQAQKNGMSVSAFLRILMERWLGGRHD